ncbi:MAG TPA: phosphoglycolate phosphatase [Macromonas sp.]|nr:phosphoglycolate phosphatase [Macromonas sp.]
MHQLVLFDLDGTLLDSAAEITAAINDALQAMGVPPVEQAQVVEWIGHGTRDLLSRVARWAEAQHFAVDVQRLLDLYDRHYGQRCGTDSALYPTVRDTLLALSERGVKLALVTNKEWRFVRPLLQAHGLLERFDMLVCGDTYPQRKPDPTGVQACLERFQVLPQHALLVGDSAVDVLTARRAGIAVWAVPYGYNQGEPVAASGPDRVIDDFRALIP